MKPFWEDEYLNKEKSTFGNPSKEVKELVPYLKKDAKILDVGCGDGRHALYLASLGFQVDAFDLSKNAIEKINYLKQKNNLNIHTWICDVLDYPFRYSYDLIIVHGVLQFIDKTKQPQVIELLKKWTNVNGYHVIALFTDEEPIPDDLKDVMVGVFKNEEIKDYYTNWKTLMFENKKFHDEHENGIKHLHAMNKMNIELYDKIKNLYLKCHKEKTWNHVENVAKEAKKLAIQYHLNIEKCMIAALLHDISAILSPDDMYKYAKELGYQIDPSEEKYHFLLHQRISKEIAYDYFHIEDEDILSAIECHTTLKKEMNDYDKIIFLADKLAWDQGGIPPYYQQLKNAINISLDKGCYWFISYQFETHQLLMPHTWLLEAYEKLKQTNEGK